MAVTGPVAMTRMAVVATMIVAVIVVTVMMMRHNRPSGYKFNGQSAATIRIR
jgi:preprotein translocase subunit SecG